MLTISQYELMKKAYNLKMVDKELWLHLQAYENFRAQATKQIGKRTVPIYPEFKDFYNYEEKLNRVKDGEVPKVKTNKLGDLLRKEEEHG
jgi:hypothetical protein